MLSHALRARADRAYVSNVEFVGAASGGTSATIPTHAIDDLIILQINRIDLSTATVTVPGGYTVVPGTSGINATSWSYAGIYGQAGCYYKVATTTSEVTGTWTNASIVTAIVLRGQHATTQFGGVSREQNFASNSANFPALTIAAVKRANMLLGIAVCSNPAIPLDTSPARMTNVYDATSGSYEAAVHIQKRAREWSDTYVNYSVGSGAIFTSVLEIISS